MKINTITTSKLNYTPAFKSNNRTVRDKNGQFLYRNTTSFFREDLIWDKFVELIKEKYKNTDKVNIMCYACSDGSEPMSLAMLLRENFGEEAEKFFPIIAKDIDSTVIYTAKGDYVNMDYADFETINKYTGGNFEKYFKRPLGGIGIEYDYLIRMNPLFKKMINYSIADITKDVSNIPPENTIIFCRNFWPYIESAQERTQLVNNLAQQLKTNCTIVIGNFDDTVETHRLLRANGFRNHKMTNVFETMDGWKHYYTGAHNLNINDINE